jgi:hypothetical protein
MTATGGNENHISLPGLVFYSSNTAVVQLSSYNEADEDEDYEEEEEKDGVDQARLTDPHPFPLFWAHPF